MYLDTIHGVIKGLYPNMLCVINDNPASQDEYILVKSVEGRKPWITLDLEAIKRPSVKVVVVTESFTQGFEISTAIYNALLGFSKVNEIINTLPEMDIVASGRNNKGFSGFYCIYGLQTV